MQACSTYFVLHLLVLAYDQTLQAVHVKHTKMQLSHTTRSARLATQATPVTGRRMLVVRRFKNGSDDAKLREIATMPEQPITTKYPPPSADLDEIIPHPGEVSRAHVQTSPR